MEARPTEMRRLGETALSITWEDGIRHEIPSRTLRMNCPCATCRELRGDGSHAAPLTAKKSSLRIVEASSDEETRLEKIWAIGGYALGIAWGDGHTDGIFTYRLLRQLGSALSEGASAIS